MGVDQAIPYLLDSFLDKGLLPNISKLIENGVKAEGLSCPPCDTPTNWTTIATGATTALHGATSFYVHIPGEHFELGLQERSRSQLSKFCTAEYLWDVADRSGYRPYVVNYPSGWPGNFKNGAMTVLVWPIPESLPRVLKPQSIFSLTNDKHLSLEMKLGGNAAPTKISFKKNTFLNLEVQSNLDQKGVSITSEDWSDWISYNLTTEFGILPCLFKLKILEADENIIKIQSSAIYNTIGWNAPDTLGVDLIKNVMDLSLNPNVEKIEYKISGDVASYIEYAQKETTAVGKAVELAQNRLNWDVCFFHVHLLDSVNHKELAYLHKDSPIYTEQKTEQAATNVKNAYKLVDGLVGFLWEKCIDENTIFALVSDHGAMPSWKIANVPLTLMKAGLLSYKWKSSDKKYVVDWKNTFAFPYLEPPFIWINLKGRDPNGIVSQQAYESTQEAIIEALYSMRDPETNAKVVKLALKRQEADFLGLNGERIGDIVYFLNPPYQIYDEILEQLNPSEISAKNMVLPEVYPAKHCFGAHAYYLPTEKLGPYSNSVPIILNGPGLQKGISLKNRINLTDLAPTFARILDIGTPKNSVGRVLHEILA